MRVHGAGLVSAIATIGRCIGCDRPARLDDRVCRACLTRRGRGWAEASGRCRSDPEFARAVYMQIATESGRRLFLAIYGASLVRASGTTAGLYRDDEGRWRWEPERTLPPAPARTEGGS